MLNTYLNRLKNHLKGINKLEHVDKTGLPGDFYEKVVINVFLKFFLEFFSIVLNQIIKTRDLRHEKLEREKKIFLNRLRENNIKYHNSLETFIHFVYFIADVDVPYFQTYNEAIRIIQQDLPQKDQISMYCHDLKKGYRARHPAEKFSSEKINEKIREKLIEKKDRELGE